MGPPWLFWSGAWLAVCVATLGVLLARRAPTLWRGRSLLSWTIGLAVVAAAATLIRDDEGLAALLTAMAALVLVAWSLRRHVLISGNDLAELGRTIEGSARRVNLSPCATPGGVVLPLPVGELRVTIRPIGPRLTLLSSRAVPPHRKAELFVRLLAKQYRGVLPTLVIRE